MAHKEWYVPTVSDGAGPDGGPAGFFTHPHAGAQIISAYSSLDRFKALQKHPSVAGKVALEPKKIALADLLIQQLPQMGPSAAVAAGMPLTAAISSISLDPTPPEASDPDFPYPIFSQGGLAMLTNRAIANKIGQLWDNVCYVGLRATEPIPAHLHAAFGTGGFEGIPDSVWQNFFGGGAKQQEFYILASPQGLYYEQKADGGHAIPFFLHAGDASKLIESHVRNGGAHLGGQDPAELRVVPLSPKTEEDAADPTSWVRGMLVSLAVEPKNSLLLIAHATITDDDAPLQIKSGVALSPEVIEGFILPAL
jgi:hypothetical protein